MSKNIGYYPKVKSGTRQAITSFDRMLPKMGKIITIRGEYDKKNWYRVRFINEDGKQFVFYGFAWWYGGEGPRGLVECINKLDLDIDASFLFEHKYKGDDHLANGFIIHTSHIEHVRKRTILAM